MWNRRRDGTRSAVLALSLALGAVGGRSTPSRSPRAVVGAVRHRRRGRRDVVGGHRRRRGHDRVHRQRVRHDVRRGGPAPADAVRCGRCRWARGERGPSPYGPGVDVSFPTDPFLVPFLVPQQVDNPLEGPAVGRVRARPCSTDARRITDPAERSLALRQIANGAIAGNQLVLAHNTLEESITASSHVTVPLVRDQRLIGLVMSLTALSDALLRVASENRGMNAPADEAQTWRASTPRPKHSEPDRDDPDGAAGVAIAPSTWPRSSATRPIATRCSTTWPRMRRSAAPGSPTTSRGGAST